MAKISVQEGMLLVVYWVQRDFEVFEVAVESQHSTAGAFGDTGDKGVGQRNCDAPLPQLTQEIPSLFPISTAGLDVG